MSKLILAAFAIACISILATAQSAQPELIVKGRVLDAGGNPVVGAQVTAGPTWTLKGVTPTGRSDERGEFSVVVHQTGEFFVSATKPVERHQSTANRFYYPFAAKAALVTVVADQPAPFATVQFGPKEGMLAIRAVDMQTREPMKQVMISLCRTEAPKYCHRMSSVSPNGVHSVLVPDVPFTLQISAPGYTDAFGEDLDQDGLQVMRIASEATRQIIVGMEKATNSTKDLLPAPKIIAPADGLTLWDTPHPRTLTAEWTPVAGAKSYTVEVEVCEWEKPDGGKCEKGTMPLTRWRNAPPPSGIEGTKYEFVFPGTQPGRWRVWAVDAKGRPGAKTPWSLFFYKSELVPVLSGAKP